MIRQLVICWLLLPVAAAPGGPLIPNGNLEQADGEWPANWPRHDHAAWLEEGGNHFIRQTAAGTDKMVLLYRSVSLPEDAQAFKLSFRVRFDGVKPGKQNWHDARVMIDFKDASGRKLPGGPAHPSFKGSCDGWQTRVLGLTPPPGATTLEIMPTLFQAAAGTFDIDDLELTPIPLEDAGFVNHVLSPHMPLPADCASRELIVRGSRLVAKADGREVHLQGVALPGLEWSPAGENTLKSVDAAFDDWRANVIRLPVHSDFWFGRRNGDREAAYRKLVDEVVGRVQRKGGYVVIDLHEFRAPRQAHADFWRDLAGRYANHPGVIFGLFNEPHGISWTLWRDGGWVTDKPKPKPGVASENVQPVKAFHSIGMQRLLDVVRKAGARNLVTASGTDWGYDLSGVLDGYALSDRGGSGIVYETHVYPWKRDWQKRFLDVAGRYPILIGELGCTVKPMSFIPPSAHERPETWAPDMLGLIQKHRLHWTAWAFHPKCQPSLLQDWRYAPTPHWGQPVKEALAGRTFELKRLR